MENEHSNIAYSCYKDYEHLTTNDFSEEKQEIWDFVKGNFHVTHKRITDKELSEFTKIYINHFLSKETENLKRGNHFYTVYHIVDASSNIVHDRQHKLYIDKDNQIVILEKTDNKYGDLKDITEDIIKEAETKESRYCALDDRLADRKDKWLQKYNEWLGIGV